MTAQAVPGHIGAPPEYEDDPFADFLPPALTQQQTEAAELYRAVVFVTDDSRDKGGEGCHAQQYRDPLLVLTGEEYAAISYSEVAGRVMDALAEGHPHVVRIDLKSQELVLSDDSRRPIV